MNLRIPDHSDNPHANIFLHKKALLEGLEDFVPIGSLSEMRIIQPKNYVELLRFDPG